MGKQIHMQKVIELFNKSPVVNISSIKRIIKINGNPDYSKQLVRNLVLSRKIKKIAKSCYTIHDDPGLIVFCYNPSYLGLQDSMSQHNLWEQETIPVIITSRKIRQGIRKVNGNNVLIRRINKKYVFGINYLKEGDFYFPYSDIEKTFIDMVYFRQPISNEAINEFKKRINKQKLNQYLKKYPKRFQEKFLNF